MLRKLSEKDESKREKVVAIHKSLDKAKVLGNFLFGILGPVLFFVINFTVDVLVRYL